MYIYVALRLSAMRTREPSAAGACCAGWKAGANAGLNAGCVAAAGGAGGAAGGTGAAGTAATLPSAYGARSIDWMPRRMAAYDVLLVGVGRHLVPIPVA